MPDADGSRIAALAVKIARRALGLGPGRVALGPGAAMPGAVGGGQALRFGAGPGLAGQAQVDNLGHGQVASG